MPAPFVLIAASLAGASAVVSQLVWMRAFGRTVGASPMLGVSVFATFVVCLGLGALGGSRFASRSARPARVGAIALLAAGVWIAASPILLTWIADMAVGLDSPPTAIHGALFAALLVLVPAILLGSLFPFLVRSRVFELKHAAGRAGRLYACEALGAALGVVLLFVALPAFGEILVLRGAGAAALVGALLLLLADRPLPHGSGPPPEGRIGSPVARIAPALAVCMSGVAAIGAETAWLEVLEPLSGSQPVAVTIELALVAVGFALGLMSGGVIAGRLRRPDLALGTVLALAGYLLVLPLPLLGDLPTRVLAAGNPSGGERIWLLVSSSIPVLLPASLCLGVVFPLAVRARADWTGAAASSAGRMYAWEAVGHVGGAVLVGLVLRPLLGGDGALMCLGFVAVAVAAGMRLFAIDAARLVPTIVLVLPLTIWLWPGVLDGWREAQPSPPEIAATQRPMPPGLSIRDRDDTKLYTASFVGRLVTRSPAGGRFSPPYRGMGGPVDAMLTVAGPVELVRRGDVVGALRADDTGRPPRAEVALGLLPALLHPAPERALVIGTGAGWAPRSVLAARVADIDLAEARLVTKRAVDDWFGVEDPLFGAGRVVVRPVGGRAMLRAGGPYDIVAASDCESLLTLEGLATLRGGLADDGVAAIMLDLRRWDEDGFSRLVVTVRDTFDHILVWRFGDKVVVVVSPAPLVVRPSRWRTVLTGDGPGASLARATGFAGPPDLLRHIALDANALGRLRIDDSEPFVDDVPRPVFSRLGRVSGQDLHTWLDAAFPPDLRRAIPDGATHQDWVAAATDSWLADDLTLAGLWAARAGLGANAEGKRVQAAVRAAAGNASEAAALYAEAARLAPDRGEIVAAHIRLLPALVRRHPERYDGVVAEIERACVEREGDGRVLVAAALAYGELGDVDRAKTTFETALDAGEPPPPDGAGIQYAQLLLATPPVNEAQVRGAFERDPKLYEDLVALDLYISLLEPIVHATRMDHLDAVLRTLERDRAIELARTARAHLGRLAFSDAVRAAVAWTDVAPTDPEAWAVRGLAALAFLGAQQPGPVDAARALPAVEAFSEAIRRSRSPSAMRERVVRMLGWYDVPPSALPDRGALGTDGD